MKRRQLIIILGVLVLLAVGASFLLARRNGPKPAAVQVPKAAEEAAAPLHPLWVEETRGRQFPGGEIKVEREVGRYSSYTSYVITYPSDGFKIYALMNVPTGQVPVNGWPVVIFTHGFIEPSQYQTLGSDYRYWIDGISSRGYILIKPDLRGHGQSEGEPQSGQWSPVYTYDVLNLVASMKTYPAADASKIAHAGHSMGGTIGLRAAVVSKDIKASVILAGAVGSAYDLYYNWTRRNRSQTPPPSVMANVRQQLVETYGEPKANPDFWDKASPINYVDAITGPVQIQHGADDGTVPILFSEKLHDALVKAGKPVEYYPYPGIDHQFAGVGPQVLQRMLALFDRTLKN